MNMLMINLFLGLLLTGCSSYRSITKDRTPIHASKKNTKVVPVKTISEYKGHYAVWELLNINQLSLQLKNVDGGNNLTLIIEKGISQKEVPPGDWELTGFEEDGTSYISMKTSKKFVFRMKAKTDVYAGSILIGCPKIATQDLRLLRDMKFFNRYPFSSSVGLCELIVGNDFASVLPKIKKSRNSKKLNIFNAL